MDRQGWMSVWTGLLGIALGMAGTATVMLMTTKPCPCVVTPTPPVSPPASTAQHTDGWSLNPRIHYR